MTNRDPYPFLAWTAGGIVGLAIVLGLSYLLAPRTKTVTVKPAAPKLYPLKGSRSVSIIGGKTMIVCSAKGRTKTGGPLNPNLGPRPGDLYVNTCRAYALAAKKKGPVA